MATYEKVTVTLTRDSVCAGDDADAPHEETVEVRAFNDPVEFLNQFSTGYLASVAGVGHSWTAVLNGRSIGTMFVDRIEPLIEYLDFMDKNALFFKYHSAKY